MDDRLQRLEGDKDSLQMQVSILMDQIEAQTDKIADLERTLSDRAFQLQRSEENLQKVKIFTFISLPTRQAIILFKKNHAGIAVAFGSRDASIRIAQWNIRPQIKVRRPGKGQYGIKRTAEAKRARHDHVGQPGKNLVSKI